MMTNEVNLILLEYLNKLIDQQNNTYHHFVDKKPVDDDYSEKLNRARKLLNLKLAIEYSEIFVTENFLFILR